MSITISHTPAEGTLVEGDTKPHKDTIKAQGLRWSRQGFWYVRGSRDRHPDTGLIVRLADALRDAGAEVAVEVDVTPRPVAQVEADRAERAHDRADALDAKAGRLAERADAQWADYRQRADAIPLGQPMMPDHHSYGRDRNYRERMHALADRSMETATAAGRAAERAQAAEGNQRHRESGPTTERRINKLEAEHRQLGRKLGGHTRTVSKGTHGHTDIVETIGAATGASRDRYEARLTRVEEELAYWRQHLAQLVADGKHRVWTRDDFRPGDLVRASGRWHKVLRVNPKTLTVPTPYSWTDTIPYDAVSDRRAASDTDPQEPTS